MLPGNPMADATPASVCGLAVALPMTRDDIAAALAGGRYSDYVGRSAALGAERLWQNGLARLAEGIELLAGVARAQGVRVAIHATGSDITRLFETCRVVTVLAHWRGPEIAPRDLRVPPRELASRIADDTSGIGVLFRQGLAQGWQRTLDSALDDRVATSRLAELLDARMQALPALGPPPAGTSWVMDEITLRHFNRDCLEAWWPEALVPGNRLELSDGRFTPRRIADLVPDAWNGIADFSSCQSAQLIDWIKQARADRIVVANERETSPMLRMAVLHAVYELLAGAPLNYADVRRAISLELSKRSTTS